jgi:hypothetical protein
MAVSAALFKPAVVLEEATDTQLVPVPTWVGTEILSEINP